MEPIYGPPASKRPRKRVPEAPARSLRGIEIFWLCVLGVLCFGLLVYFDEGDPDINESLRQLERNQHLLDNMRVPPVHIDLPIFEPLQTAEIIQNQPVPATPLTATPLPDPPPALQTAEIISSPPRRQYFEPTAPQAPARQRPAEPEPEPEPDEPGRLQSAGIIRR